MPADVTVLEPAVPEPLELLAGFARALRAAGLAVTLDRTSVFVQAAGLAGAGNASALYWAGRATLCSDPQDTPVYDRVFDAWFSGRLPGRVRSAPARTVRPVAPLGGDDGEGSQESADLVRAAASAVEVLRHRDVAELSAQQRAELNRLLGGLRVRLPRRAAARRRPSARGAVDARRTVREQLRRGGEVGPVQWRRRGTRPRGVVLLVDVSGSMAPYADSLLRLGHLMVRASVATGGRVEVFSVGTRLTRVTPALRRTRDPDAALRAAGELVPDWSGGTRLGEALEAFVNRWGQRGLARGAVVVVCSDGWERGGAALLGEQVLRLHRLAHRLVWLNPHRGKEGYRPVQSGIAAALPYLDDLLAGHSLAAFEEMLGVVSRA